MNKGEENILCQKIGTKGKSCEWLYIIILKLYIYTPTSQGQIPIPRTRLMVDYRIGSKSHNFSFTAYIRELSSWIKKIQVTKLQQIIIIIIIIYTCIHIHIHAFSFFVN